jgi:hypothetical protein
LETLFGNAALHPTEEKYRTLRIRNPALKKRIWNISEIPDLLLSLKATCLLRDFDPIYVLPMDKEVDFLLFEALRHIRESLATVEITKNKLPKSNSVSVI